jgi:hypothetical protein
MPGLGGYMAVESVDRVPAQGPPVQAGPAPKPGQRAFWSRWITALALVGLPVIWGIWKWHGHGSLVNAMVVLAVFWAFALALLEWVGSRDVNANRRRYGFVDLVIGADGRVSTSQTVVWVWTCVFASALVIMTSLVAFGPLTSGEAFQTGSDWDAYLLLLGGPFASAVIAKGIVSHQTQQDPTSKSGTPAASATANAMSATTQAAPSAADIVSGDSNGPSLVDVQYTIFSLVAILYFVGVFIANLDKFEAGTVNASSAPWLPQIPSALLGLTSLAALTYVGNKAVQNQGLSVVFSPNPAPRDTAVRATLGSLPATATLGNTTMSAVSAAGITVPVAVTAVDTVNSTLTFTAPETPGTYSVTLAGPGTFGGAITLVVQ